MTNENRKFTIDRIIRYLKKPKATLYVILYYN